jgi:ATP-binding cassette subfamily B protein
MVAKHFGRNFKQQSINKMCQINREGVSLLGISDAAEKIGFRNNTLKNKNYFVPAKEIVCRFNFN